MTSLMRRTRAALMPAARKRASTSSLEYCFVQDEMASSISSCHAFDPRRRSSKRGSALQRSPSDNRASACPLIFVFDTTARTNRRVPRRDRLLAARSDRNGCPAEQELCRRRRCSVTTGRSSPRCIRIGSNRCVFLGRCRRAHRQLAESQSRRAVRRCNHSRSWRWPSAGRLRRRVTVIRPL